MPSKSIQFFHRSAGGLLLAVAAALFFSSRVGADIVLPRDPIFAISIGHLFWIFSGMCLGVALFTLSGKPTFMRAMVIAWLATNLAVYCLGCLWYGGHSLGVSLPPSSDFSETSRARRFSYLRRAEDCPPCQFAEFPSLRPAETSGFHTGLTQTNCKPTA